MISSYQVDLRRPHGRDATQILIGFVAMVTPLTGLVGADCGCALGPRASMPGPRRRLKTIASSDLASPWQPSQPGSTRSAPIRLSCLSDGKSPARLVRFRRPFRLDTAAVTRGQFAQFCPATGHRTDAETAGESFVPDILVDAETFSDPVVVPGRVANAPWWLPVRGATWRRRRSGESKVAAGVVEWVLPGSYSRFRHPAVHVSWRDADAYCCRWQGKRLPTEDEWEAACRAGLSTDRCSRGATRRGRARRHRMNIWQGEFPRLNTADDGYVDAYGPQNSFGLYNMVGNVWEWTASRWDRNGAPDELPQRPAASDEMTKKGGSFMCTRATAIATGGGARSQNTADTSSANIGFRCAIDMHAAIAAAELSVAHLAAAIR
uniref:FGE-sulfatase domain-containing protein n=1 Tax=Macrostomum lignano TaxID=282301 RepID=A0A1I8JM82_9PLAT